MKIDIGSVTLYHGDMFDLVPTLPRLFVHAVITDPPYLLTSGGNTSKQMKGGIFDPKVYNNNGKIVGSAPRFDAWLPLIADLHTDLEVLFMCNDKNMREALSATHLAQLSLHNILVWDKGIKTPNRWFMKEVEFTIYAWKGTARPINNMGASQVQRIRAKVGSRFHPTEKPIELMQFYIEHVTDTGAVVLDPFMGSGSTLCACLASNRRGIGIEKDYTHFQKAVERCEKLFQENENARSG